MANLNTRYIPLSSGILNEILEPCLTPKRNYIRGKTKSKENLHERFIFVSALQKLALESSTIEDLGLGIDKCIPKF